MRATTPERAGPARVLLTAVVTAAAVVVVSLLAGGCQVEPQERPEPVPSLPAAVEAPATDAPGEVRTTIYLVRRGRLLGVRRDVVSARLDVLLAGLGSGPTREEVMAGIRTAVAPQSFSGARSDSSTRVAVVDASQQFAGISGGDQLLAVAQLVWTVTEAPGITGVRLMIDGQPVEVPTDDGLSGAVVGRDDYDSVAPRRPAERAAAP